jgi:FkbM family methyltransferase
MKAIVRMWLKLKRRVVVHGKHLLLKLGALRAAGVYWKDYGCLKLPFHNDGDGQELLYHLHGAHWWQKEKSVLAPFLKRGSVALDVGANLGLMTGVLSHLVGPDGHVHSFEPSPTTHRKLAALVAENKLLNVTTHNLGCSDEEGQLHLNLTENSGYSSLRSANEIGSGVKEIQVVQVVTLDDYLAVRLKRLDLIKIDTEGFEDRVLSGARHLLRRFRPVVYIELASEFRDSSERAVTLLRQEGYHFDVEPDLSAAHTGDNFIAKPSEKLG